MTGQIVLTYTGIQWLAWSSISWGTIWENLPRWMSYSFDSPVTGKNLFKFTCQRIKSCSSFWWFLPYVKTLFLIQNKGQKNSSGGKKGGFKRSLGWLTFDELLNYRFHHVIENSVFSSRWNTKVKEPFWDDRFTAKLKRWTTST